MSPDHRLLLAILGQAIRDYTKLDPDSDKKSAEFEETEGLDYKTAEDFLYNGALIYYGKVTFNFNQLCNLLEIDPHKLKKSIALQAKEY